MAAALPPPETGRGDLRVAVTLEQCWHRVPGGVARAALGSVDAVDRIPGVRQVGVAAWHRGPPPGVWRPTIGVRRLALGRRALYESWHRLRHPDVQRATGPVDVIHATGMAIPPAARPLVVTMHDLAWERWPEFFTPRGVRFFRRSLELTRRDATVVVCPSQATATDVVDAGIDADRVQVVPWGVTPVPVDGQARTDVRDRYDLSGPFVLWVGTIEPRKNLPVVLDAVARLARRDLRLVLVGPDGWRQDLPPEVADPDGGVQALGFVPAADLAALYAEAEVFCFPSLGEGFGLPVLEAMAQGTPVVTSQGTATEEVLGDGGIAVDPADPIAVAQALEAVLASREHYATAAAARARLHTWDRTAQGLVACYRRAAGSAGAP